MENGCRGDLGSTSSTKHRITGKCGVHYSYYGTYTPIQKCEEVGRDLVYSRTATSWICNRNRNNKKFFDLKVRYRNQPH
jgi:hypothetical protein